MKKILFKEGPLNFRYQIVNCPKWNGAISRLCVCACVRACMLTLLSISSVSDCSSADSCMRERCACSRRFVFTCGSLNLGFVSLLGSRWHSWQTDRWHRWQTGDTGDMAACWQSLTQPIDYKCTDLFPAYNLTLPTFFSTNSSDSCAMLLL